MVNLSTPLKNLPHVTPKYTKTLEKLGLHTVQDLLLYFPFRYEDYRKVVPISDQYLDQTVTVVGRVVKTKNNRLFPRRMTVTEVFVQDENNTPLKAVWFNQPFILNSVRTGDQLRLSGKLTWKDKMFFMGSPQWEKSTRDATNTGCLVPVYSETSGITSKWIRWQIKPLLELAQELPDVLPYSIREKYNLYDIYTTIIQLHFPASREKIIRAQKRLAFQEMFLMQLKTLQVKNDWERKSSIDIPFQEKLIKNFVDNLPFQLTNAQRKASFEILKDLAKSKPMNRLLNGDVGSGKTVVAAIAALQAMSAGYQVAILAPTEVLAKQHFESFAKLFGKYNLNIALLTNSYKLVSHIENKNLEIDNFKFIKNWKLKIKNYPRNEIKITRNYLLNAISRGGIPLVIGTHAIIQKDVTFQNLALAIIDEQHRFGVAQRAALQQETIEIKDGKEKTIPHLLTMTATPIPRTLAIAFFGSLDLSVLDEMPSNRKPIITKIVPPEERENIYNFLRTEIKKGRQAFIVLPFVEESKAMSEVKAAIIEHEKLARKIFPDLRLGLLHGKLKAKEKEEVMKDFKDKKTDILVSTPVVEVGIDVPNASVMIIENSERFGLAQLHQFRGRVGRGEHQSYCFLFTESSGKKLKILEKSNNGFEIAEADLKLRGPGQFFGVLQSGLPDITMENLSNVKLIKFAREEAQDILKYDPQLKKHPILSDALQKFQEKIHLE